MTRLQLAEEYAERARDAQQSGDHRSAAALFAEALQLLALPFHEASEDVNEAGAAPGGGRDVRA